MSRIRRIAPGLGRGGLLGNTEGPESYLRELDTLPSQFCRATGGTETVISQGGKFYRVHTFTDVGTSSLTFTRGGFVEYLIVGGGGGGGSRSGVSGGGGAGGLIFKNSLLSPSNYSIFVGAGGQRQYGNTFPYDGGPGEDSTAFGDTALGGGAFYDYDTNSGLDGSGGSGAGGGRHAEKQTGGARLQPTSSSGGFGNSGGDYGGSAGNAGGGGGAGAAGSSTGAGGIGKYYGDKFGDSPGDSGYFAGGGGGAPTITGGLGGGGDGTSGCSNAQDGAPNTGGGGGAQGNTTTCITGFSGAGGSGIVIARYRITQAEYEAEAA